MRVFAATFAVIIVAGLSLLSQAHDVLNLVLPTHNENIFSGGSRVYYYVERDYKGEESNPWEAANMALCAMHRDSCQIVYQRFHEGSTSLPLSRRSW
jgi:hypothetical protein